jgi:hypothetical protein
MTNTFISYSSKFNLLNETTKGKISSLNSPAGERHAG